MQKQGQGIDHPRLRRSSDSGTPRKRTKRHTIPLLDKLPGAPSKKDGRVGPLRRMKKRITNPLIRQNDVLRHLISSLVMKGPTSLLSAYKYYFESSFTNPLHFTTYARINGKLRGHIRIENRRGQSVMSPHHENLSIADDYLVQSAMENNSIYLIDGNKVYSIDRAGTDTVVKKEKIPFVSGLSRMVIPLDDMCGLIDITGEDLSFGFLSPVSTSLKIARDFSNLVSMKMASEIDVLTGLLNRRAFDDALDHYLSSYLEQGTNTSLLMLDIDRFKKINDQHGHQNGDLVLSTCALTAMSCFRASDLLSGEKTDNKPGNGMRKEMVARHGGEEFAVLLPETDPQNAIKAAQRCKHAIESTVINGINGEKMTVTVSMGIASFADAQRMLDANASDQGVVIYPMENKGEIVRKTTQSLADKALYYAKGSGRNLLATAISDEQGRVEYSLY